MADEMDPKPRLARRYKVLLGVSLALNLAVAGLVAGTAFRHGGDGMRGMRSAGFGAYGLPYMIALPKAERRDVIRAVRADREGGVPDRAARRALYSEVLTALRSTPFDAEKLSVAMSGQADAAIRVQKSAQSAWLEVISQMSDAERSAYANEVEEVLRRGPPHKKPAKK
ncbi:periplasmic heavy metal sensor [uncultured Roseobacter sp.]|uniref:periplasmic heavy metal sensor n=1 Tax=uncultured Roseobacter sp. TaxID=114847 RepID=UPI0026093D82|nr:periplasmic heavy metal sensor [uncultured Roseobacter sp.]